MTPITQYRNPRPRTRAHHTTTSSLPVVQQPRRHHTAHVMSQRPKRWAAGRCFATPEQLCFGPKSLDDAHDRERPCPAAPVDQETPLPGPVVTPVARVRRRRYDDTSVLIYERFSGVAMTANAESLGAIVLEDTIVTFRKQKELAERALAQISDDDFFRTIDAESNSIAILAKHVGGNLLSRWTDFLTSDGEKPTRDRDGEFVANDTD